MARDPTPNPVARRARGGVVLAAACLIALGAAILPAGAQELTRMTADIDAGRVSDATQRRILRRVWLADPLTRDSSYVASPHN